MTEVTPEAAYELARSIARTLDERMLHLIVNVVTVIGPERTKKILEDTLATISEGGLMVASGHRPRTKGGIFFFLVRKFTKKEESRAIFPRRDGRVKIQGEKPATPVHAIAVWDWAKILETIKRSREQIGEAKPMKITLIGRPLRVANQQTYVVISMKGAPPASLPNGLPPIPAGTEITWAVFITRKQWAKASANLDTQPEDKLIIEGYPFQEKGVHCVMANACKSMLADRAAKEAKAAAPNGRQ